MAFMDFLDHTCDIYHIVESVESPGYNLPSSPSFTYSEIPDISNQVCHFGVSSMSVSITQKEPQNVLEGKIKLTLPTGTDIRLNDKIVWCQKGLEFIAEIPRNIRGHHIFVYIQRVERQKAL